METCSLHVIMSYCFLLIHVRKLHLRFTCLSHLCYMYVHYIIMILVGRTQLDSGAAGRGERRRGGGVPVHHHHLRAGPAHLHTLHDAGPGLQGLLGTALALCLLLPEECQEHQQGAGQGHSSQRGQGRNRHDQLWSECGRVTADTPSVGD